MATTAELVVVRRNATWSAGTQNPFPTGRMLVTSTNGGTSLFIPFAPRNTVHDGRGADYARVPRAGRKDVLVYLKTQLPTMRMNLLVADKVVSAPYQPTFDGVRAVVPAVSVINALSAWYASGDRLTVTYGSLESGIWRITSMSVETQLRGLDNEPTVATVDIEFTSASDFSIGVGPVTGGVKPPATAPTAPPKSNARTHTVKRGDTLWDISIKFYKTGTSWRRIADANKIKDPKKLQIGTVLKIP